LTGFTTGEIIEIVVGFISVVLSMTVIIGITCRWDMAKFALLMMSPRKVKEQTAFFAREAFKTRGRNEMSEVYRAVAFDNFMRWSGYMDYSLNERVFEEMREAGLL
jgi:hypothetical protein